MEMDKDIVMVEEIIYDLIAFLIEECLLGFFILAEILNSKSLSGKIALFIVIIMTVGSTILFIYGMRYCEKNKLNKKKFRKRFVSGKKNKNNRRKKGNSVKTRQTKSGSTRIELNKKIRTPGISRNGK